MTNAEAIRNMSDKELAEFLCELVYDTGEGCSDCPVIDKCGVGHNGFKKWLNEEGMRLYE